MYNDCITFIWEANMNSNHRMDWNELEQQKNINYKYCEYCGAAIPRSSEFSCCANCQDTIIFREVKEYIRSNNVNEFQVAERFNIPLRIVKQWMRDQRIEYIRPKYDPNSF